MTANVLVIDQESLLREELVSFLAQAGFNVVASDASAEVLLRLAAGSVDAVICDLTLVRSHAMDLLHHIQTHYAHLPVLVMSSNTDSQAILFALRHGADDYLLKPIADYEVLLLALNKALERARLIVENEAYRDYLEKTNRELKHHLDELHADQLAGRHAQLRMLPETLLKESVVCKHRLIPSLLLSGDFLDYFEYDDDHLAFYIADVSGHGASSAFVTVLLKNVTYRLKRNFRRGSSEELIHPSQVLARISSELFASELEKHVTMIYGILNTRTRELQYSVGGHFPMPILVADGKATYLEGRGMPVGLFNEAVYQDYTLQLPASFALWLFSDGILEIMTDATLNEKEQRLLHLVRDSHGSIDLLSQLLSIDERDEVPDDIAMAVIKRGEV